MVLAMTTSTFGAKAGDHIWKTSGCLGKFGNKGSPDIGGEMIHTHINKLINLYIYLCTHNGADDDNFNF